MTNHLEFVYVGDPMCSWCWGFSPVMERLAERHAVPVRVVVGGLRPGPDAQVLDERLRGVLRHHWEAVQAASGQSFDYRALDREGWRYDTEPACRAVVAMRALAPDETLRWFSRLQRAFYCEGADVTDDGVLAALTDGFAVDRQRFAAALSSESVVAQTWQDFAEAGSLGVSGFPTLLLRDGDQVWLVTRGFAPWQQLEPALTGWLQDRYGALDDADS